MTLNDVIAECNDLISKLKPIEARANTNVSIQIKNLSDFLLLSADKKTFYCEDEEATTFFFVDGGIIYTYKISEYEYDGLALLEYTKSDMERADEFDFSECTDDELLHAWQNEDGESLYTQMDAQAKRMKDKNDWLTDEFFDDLFDEGIYKIIDKELININNKLKKEASKIQDNCNTTQKIRSRGNIINEGINSILNYVDMMPYYASDKVHKSGLEHKKKTEENIRNDAKKLNLNTLNKKQIKYEIDRLSKKYNPENKKDQYHIKKNEIEYIFNELMQQ